MRLAECVKELVAEHAALLYINETKREQERAANALQDRIAAKGRVLNEKQAFQARKGDRTTRSPSWFFHSATHHATTAATHHATATTTYPATATTYHATATATTSHATATCT